MLAVFLALSLLQQPRSIYDQLVTRPDPNNGYEDYLRAADLVESGQPEAYTSWSKEQFEGLLRRREAAQTGDADPWTPADEDRLQVARQFAGLDHSGDPVLGAIAPGLREWILSPAFKSYPSASKVTHEIEDVYNRVLGTLRQGEGNWSDKPGENVGESDDPVKKMDQALRQLYFEASVGVVRRRTQLRLLGLHARILDFHWHHNRWPKTLAEAVPETLIHDPLSEDMFQYRPTPHGYDLYSMGNTETGRLELFSSGALDRGFARPIPPSRRSR